MDEEWVNVSSEELTGKAWTPAPSTSMPSTTRPTNNNIAIQFAQCSSLKVLHKEKFIWEMWLDNYLEELPSTREKRESWKQKNIHQYRWVTLIIRQWIQGQRNSEVHLVLKYIGRNIRVDSGSCRRRPTSSMIHDITKMLMLRWREDWNNPSCNSMQIKSKNP